MHEKISISIIGCGWLGFPLAQDLIDHGFKVKGSTTREEKLSLLEQVGVDAYLFHPFPSNEIRSFDLFQADQLVLTIPPNRKDPDVVEAYPSLLREIALQAHQVGVKHIIFTSTTGVYPNSNDWVSEATPPEPQRITASAAWAAEQALQEIEGLRVSILRLAGLTGPGRPAGRFFAGRKELPGANVPVNLIHLADVIGVIRQLVQEPGRWGVTLNVSATEHPLREDFYPERARLLGLEPPSFDISQADQPYKRISNKKLTRLFGYSLQYPDPSSFPLG